jgi:hypothetical protein
MGGAHLNGSLSETVSRASTSMQPVVSPRECNHTNVADGFAYVESYDMHWPIRVCRDCRSILRGRDPWPSQERKSAYTMTPRDVIAGKWEKQWPKNGRPRAKKLPKHIEWPEAA